MKTSLEPIPLHVITSDDVSAQDLGPVTLAKIYEAHFDFVWRNARRLGVPEDGADDVTQDVFIIVQRRIGTFDPRGSIRAWIFGILSRVVSDYRRSFRRKGSRNVSINHDQYANDVNTAAPDSSPLEGAERAERRHLLEQLLENLDEDKRTLLILSELEEWTLREIAELLGSNTSTIYSRLQAAKRAVEQVYARLQRDKVDLP